MSSTQGRLARGTTTDIHLARLKRLQAQRATQQSWAEDPIWDTPVPEPPDWDNLNGHEKQVYKFAAIAYAVRAVADTRGVSAARQLADWEVL